MGRPPKHTVEELKSLIVQYISDSDGLTQIKPTALALYCREKLNITDITYQTFTRNKETAAYIDELNKRIVSRVTNESATPTSIPDHLIDIPVAVSRYAASPDMADFLANINTQIAKLSDMYEKVRNDNLKLKKELNILQEQNSDLKNEIKKLSASEETLSAERKTLKAEQLKSRSTIRQIMNYLNRYLYDPAVLKHMQSIKLLPKDYDISSPFSAAVLEDNDFDIAKIISQYRKAMDEDIDNTEQTPTSKKNKDCNDMPVPMEAEPETNEILSSQAVSLIDKFTNGL